MTVIKIANVMLEMNKHTFVVKFKKKDYFPWVVFLTSCIETNGQMEQKCHLFFIQFCEAEFCGWLVRRCLSVI